MKLNEYLTENGVKLMIKGSGENYPPRQTNDLGMYDYAEGLENVIGNSVFRLNTVYRCFLCLMCFP